ncbi:MAG: DUF4145 domain-containing protein [Pseudomonas sp.]|nr:DUF4145 domain-containing protein [Pseudomonas sp.]
MVRIEIEKDKNINLKIDAPCRTCKRTTKHIILADIELKGRDETEDEFIYGWDDKYQTIQCQGCETISFLKSHMNSEDMYETNPERGEWEYATHVDIYPNPEEGREPVTDHHLLPVKLVRIYTETLSALNSNNRVLAGIGIRAIVETVCKDKQASGKDLAKKINDLVAQGVLTKDGADILHKLRTLGNDAAHEVTPHSAVQLSLALDVIDHLLQGVYILPHHANAKFK